MKRSFFKLIAGLLKLVGSFVSVIIMAVFNGTLGFLLSISITAFGGLAIVEFITGIEYISYPILFTIIICCGVGRGLLRYVEQYSNHYIAFKILAILRSKIFKQLRKLSPSKLEAKNKGEIISMIQADIETLEVFYAHTISPFLIAICTSITVLLFIGFTTSWYFSLAALVAYLVIGGVIPVIYYLRNKKDGKDYRLKLGRFEDFYLDSIYGSYEIISGNKQATRLETLDKKSEDLINTTREIENKNTSFRNITNYVIIILNVLYILVGGLLIKNNIIDSPYIILAFITFTSSFGSVVALANLPGNLTMTFASGNRVLDLLEEKPLVPEPQNSQKFDYDSLEVNHVEFKYDDEIILKDVSFKVGKNEIVGLLGPSGSGKSTILKLLMKFYEPNKGTIKYNGIDLKNIGSKDLYENINLFSQSTFLFAGTIKENLIIANPEATDAEIIEACKNASIYDYIKALPEGLETKITDLKDNLSSGEKQRLGLARVFLKKPKLLLLDEATANIDAINEGVILNALKKHKDNMAIIIISHRRSTLSICDRLYEIKDGKINA